LYILMFKFFERRREGKKTEENGRMRSTNWICF
jgi:hypothetical protein